MTTLTREPTSTTNAHPSTATRLLSITDLSAEQVLGLYDTAAAMKSDPRRFAATLAGKTWVMLFEKPSLRTRVSFEVGITKLGGHAIYFDHSAQRLGERESMKDYAMNLERWIDGIIARTFSHATLEQLAQHASIPVINALSDHEHPCQALADLLTLRERLGTLDGARLAWVGDGNNVCHSLLLLAATLGVSMTVITPRGFEPQFSVVRAALEAAQRSGATITLTHRLDLVRAHHAVYTDAWVSMGQGTQAMLRHEAFGGFQVDADLMARASEGIAGDALFMHCMPAHRGEEVTDEVIDAPYSLVYDQAENRMWAQNAWLANFAGGA